MLAVVPDPALVSDASGWEALTTCLDRLRGRFPRQLHLALSPSYDGRDRFVFEAFAMLAAKTRLPLIATNQPLYHGAQRRPLADIVTTIREHVTIADAGFLWRLTQSAISSRRVKWHGFSRPIPRRSRIRRPFCPPAVFAGRTEA